MAEPRIPGSDPERHLELPCGQTIDPHDIDLGMREYACPCGESHAAVTDVHPPSRFFPESLVAVLQETIETDDEFDEFGTPHLMGVVLEEFPEEVVTYDGSDDGAVGYAMVWLTDFDSRRLHEIVVELVVELMDHAVSHADDDSAISEFESQMLEFDVSEFVDQYRAQRNFERVGDGPV
ncbi:DUF5815 family protein [Natronobacterium gregoryi]|uniref:Uncharacterized protein n=2 Tax=Natronobacterium gregoryi TaxID=44930 RepID=L0AJ48_NATGS|nr:DUF5815 family protein [Natronobacterium gregoryi]AFZ73928.1 hypothetical protein Natgr_2784 [Natronobacterium gregoryi SP2]ELY71736.1 hypothetical protein C490_04847 [Natronobacterium gregoryi SP2]PLK19508.1 hypothetical protein CYV19_14275 [Natronobacterium gregoryi SP2]SFJ46794.1 hypothetical protein SAMN05443661_1322 [Natronobacterium gregoryi]